MAFRASNVIPSKAYDQVRILARNVKSNCAHAITRMATSGADYTFLRDVRVFLANADAQFAELATTPGLPEYAAAQENDPAYDVAAEFTAMRGAIQAATGWMDANVPTSVTAVAPSAWVSAGPLIATTFTAAQTAPLRTQLQAVADCII